MGDLVKLVRGEKNLGFCKNFKVLKSENITKS